MDKFPCKCIRPRRVVYAHVLCGRIIKLLGPRTVENLAVSSGRIQEQNSAYCCLLSNPDLWDFNYDSLAAYPHESLIYDTKCAGPDATEVVFQEFRAVAKVKMLRNMLVHAVRTSFRDSQRNRALDTICVGLYVLKSLYMSVKLPCLQCGSLPGELYRRCEVSLPLTSLRVEALRQALGRMSTHSGFVCLWRNHPHRGV